MITSPYNKLELILAVNALSDEQITKIDKCFDNLGDLQVEDKAELNAKAAAYNGISLEALISSPNYTTLLEEYQGFLVMSLIERLEQEGLSNIEAWGLILGALDLLD